MTFSFKKTLIAALILVLAAGLIAPERVFAQGITGMVEYTVLSGQKLTVYSQPVAEPAYVLGNLEAGTHRAPGSQLSGNWYRLDNNDGSTWYFLADPSVVKVTFTSDSAPSGGDNGDGQPPQDQNFSSSITWGAFEGIPGAFLILLVVLILATLLVQFVLSLWEAIKDRRFGLLVWGVVTLGVTALTLGLLAFFNAQSESCLENTVCFANSPWGYAMSALVAVLPPVFIVIMVLNGRKVPKLGSAEEGVEVKLPQSKFWEKYDELIGEGMVPLGKPMPGVGEDADKLICTFVEEEEALHREGSPVGLVVTLMTYGMIVFGLFGQAYFGPIHFVRLEQPVLAEGTFSTASIPFFIMFFLPMVVYGIEAMVENRKRPFVVLWWFATWIGSWISPWPPLLTFALMHGIANFTDDKGKNFWKGHSDLIILTLCIGLGMAIMGFPWFYSLMGGLWLDLGTWLPSQQSVGVEFLRSIIR